MKLDELEGLILANLESLLDSCRGLCRSDLTLKLPEISEDSVLEGCDFCIVRNLLDTLGIDSLSIALGGGNTLEFFKLDDAVIEVGAETAIVVNVNDFLNRVRELTEFGTLSDEDADTVIRWFQELYHTHS